MENTSEMDQLYQEALDQLPDQRVIELRLPELSANIPVDIKDTMYKMKDKLGS